MIEIIKILFLIAVALSNMNENVSKNDVIVSNKPKYHSEQRDYNAETEPVEEFDINSYICTTPDGRDVYIGAELPDGFKLPDGVEIWDGISYDQIYDEPYEVSSD